MVAFTATLIHDHPKIIKEEQSIVILSLSWKKKGKDVTHFLCNNNYVGKQAALTITNSMTNEKLCEEDVDSNSIFDHTFSFKHNERKPFSIILEITIAGDQLYKTVPFQIVPVIRPTVKTIASCDAHSIAIDSKGRMFVSLPNQNEVVMYDLKNTTESRSLINVGLKRPLGLYIYIGSQETLLVCDYNNNRIVVYGLAAEHPKANDSLYGEFKLPTQVSAYKSDSDCLLIGDAFRNQIFLYDSNRKTDGDFQGAPHNSVIYFARCNSTIYCCELIQKKLTLKVYEMKGNTLTCLSGYTISGEPVEQYKIESLRMWYGYDQFLFCADGCDIKVYKQEGKSLEEKIKIRCRDEKDQQFEPKGMGIHNNVIYVSCKQGIMHLTGVDLTVL